MDELMTGRIWYSEHHVVVQRDGDATAMLSGIQYVPGGLAFVSPMRWLSREDALLMLERADGGQCMLTACPCGKSRV